MKIKNRIVIILAAITLLLPSAMSAAVQEGKATKISESEKTFLNYLKFLETHPKYSKENFRAFVDTTTKRNRERLSTYTEPKNASSTDLLKSVYDLVVSTSGSSADYVIDSKKIHAETATLFFSANTPSIFSSKKEANMGIVFLKKEGGKWKIDAVSSKNKPKAKPPYKDQDYFSKDLKLEDKDKDGMSDMSEKTFGTDPNKKDTDGDRYSDYDEVINGYDPLRKGK